MKERGNLSRLTRLTRLTHLPHLRELTRMSRGFRFTGARGENGEKRRRNLEMKIENWRFEISINFPVFSHQSRGADSAVGALGCGNRVRISDLRPAKKIRDCSEN